MSYYQVDEEGKPTRVIQAKSKAQAISFATKGKYIATVLTTAGLGDLVKAGADIEFAKDEE